MRKTLLAATGLGMALVLGAPAIAQAQGGQPTRMDPATAAQARQAADQRADVREPLRLLDEAERAMRAGNWPVAIELTERAHTTALNEMGRGGAQPGMGDAEPLRRMSEATTAMNARDRGRAEEALRTARQAAQQLGGLAGGPGMMPGGPAAGGTAGAPLGGPGAAPLTGADAPPLPAGAGAAPPPVVGAPRN